MAQKEPHDHQNILTSSPNKGGGGFGVSGSNIRNQPKGGRWCRRGRFYYSTKIGIIK